MGLNQTLHVAGLSKAYSKKGTCFHAVSDVSFTVDAGEIVGVLGPNGSGKTTTMKSICGLTSFDTGAIQLGGKDIRTQHRHAMSQIGAVLEGARNVYWRLTALENIIYFAGLKGLDRQQALSRADELIDRLTLRDYRDQQVRMLSKGNQQKVAIACALIHRPALVLLDEPTLGLDADTVRSLKAWLRELADSTGSAMLVTSHDMEFIEAICDRIIILFRGRVISQNTVEDLRHLYAPQKFFSLQVNGFIADEISKELKKFNWRINNDGGSTHLSLRTGNLEILSMSLNLLHKADCRLTDINASSDTLEDIFLNAVQSGAEASQ